MLVPFLAWLCFFTPVGVYNICSIIVWLQLIIDEMLNCLQYFNDVELCVSVLHVFFEGRKQFYYTDFIVSHTHNINLMTILCFSPPAFFINFLQLFHIFSTFYWNWRIIVESKIPSQCHSCRETFNSCRQLRPSNCKLSHCQLVRIDPNSFKYDFLMILCHERISNLR